VHPTCYCYWLANSFSQFLPQDACASVDVLSLFDNSNCIALLDWLVWLHLPYSLQWVLVIAILSTSLSACVVIVLLNCIDLYASLVLLYCIVYLHIPLSLQWVPVYFFSSPTCLLVIVFLLQDERFILYCYCVLLLVCCHWHWHFLLILCLLPQLLRAVAPALTLITSFKLRQVWCFASYHWLLVCWFCCSLPLLHFNYISGF